MDSLIVSQRKLQVEVFKAFSRDRFVYDREVEACIGSNELFWYIKPQELKRPNGDTVLLHFERWSIAREEEAMKSMNFKDIVDFLADRFEHFTALVKGNRNPYKEDEMNSRLNTQEYYRSGTFNNGATGQKVRELGEVCYTGHETKRVEKLIHIEMKQDVLSAKKGEWYKAFITPAGFINLISRIPDGFVNNVVIHPNGVRIISQPGKVGLDAVE